MVKSLKLLVYICMLASALAVKSVPEIFGWEGFFDLRNLLCCIIAIAITATAIVLVAIELNFIEDFRIYNKNTTQELKNRERALENEKRELENQRKQLEYERQALERDSEFLNKTQKEETDEIPTGYRRNCNRYADRSA